MRDIFAPGSFASRLVLAMRTSGVPMAERIRLFVYAACPALLAPWFALKRLTARSD